MKVKDVMTRSVAYINPKATITEAAQLMQKHNIGSIPVCDASGVIGIVTDRDIVVRNVAHGTDPAKLTVQDVMTSQVTTTTPDTDMDQVSQLMSTQRIRRLPVMDKNQLVGIVSLGDMATDGVWDMEAAATLSEISKPSKPEMMPKK